MKKNLTLILTVGIALFGTAAFAGGPGPGRSPAPDHRNERRNDDPYKGTAGGVRLAADIVSLVRAVIAPEVVYYAPPPVIVAPAPPPVIVVQPQPVIYYYPQPVVTQRPRPAPNRHAWR